MKYVVYAHVSDNGVFYIGSGTEKSAHSTKGRTISWRVNSQATGFHVAILEVNLSKEDATAKAEVWIAHLLSQGHALVNYRRDPSKPRVGKPPTQETRQKISQGLAEYHRMSEIHTAAKENSRSVAEELYIRKLFEAC